MKPLTILSVLLLLISGWACNSEEAPSQTQDVIPIEEAILGTWETIEMEAHSPTYLGQDTTIHQLIREADWGKVFGVRPASTVFTPDGKFRRTHTLQSGQVADVTNGLWQVKGTDSLLFIEPNKTLYYKHELADGRLTLTGVIDWDFDGEEDDDFRSVLRLVGKTE
ncbi:MAG: hypothetical protein AAGA31_15505 [Bacteroidota bacterium]